MDMYQLPKFKPRKLLPSKWTSWQGKFIEIVLIVLLSLTAGGVGGVLSQNYFFSLTKELLSRTNINLPQNNQDQKLEPINPKYSSSIQQEMVIKAVKSASPAVVSVVITKNVPKMKLYYREENPFKDFGDFFFDIPFEFKVPYYKQEGTEKKKIGEGSGFIISKDGLVLTNAHVVSDKTADYTVFTNEGKKYKATVLARDSIRDIAIVKIEKGGPFPTIPLGDSDQLQIGQTVIAIGNALGEFRNTVSVGVISGLGRTVTASGGNIIVTQEDVIQTDAAINPGNSGGPLLNLKGEAIGVNFAMARGAQNIGFSIPINAVKRDIEEVKKYGKITYPFLGVRYVLINEKIKEQNGLSVDYGALIVKGSGGEEAIIPGSPAEKANLQEGDIILSFNGEKITTQNSLAKIIRKYKPGDKVTLEILRGKKKKTVEVVLGERSG